MKNLAASMLGSLLPFGMAVWNEMNYFPLNATALEQKYTESKWLIEVYVSVEKLIDHLTNQVGEKFYRLAAILSLQGDAEEQPHHRSIPAHLSVFEVDCEHWKKRRLM